MTPCVGLDADAQEFEDSRDLTQRLEIDDQPLGVINRGSQRFRVHRVLLAGPYSGTAGRPVCVLQSRRHARYLVLETGAGRLIVFNVGDRRGTYTPWSTSSRSPFGVIDRSELTALLPELGAKDESPEDPGPRAA